MDYIMEEIDKHLFNLTERAHIIDRIEYLKVKFNKQIGSKIFDDTISSLQKYRKQHFVRWKIISECVERLCSVLTEKVPEFVQKTSWKYQINQSKLPLEDLHNTAKNKIITIHKKDILDIFDPGGLSWSEHQMELEKSLYKAFPNGKIPSKEPFTLNFDWIEYDWESSEYIKHPTKIVWFEKTQYISSYEKLARKIINLLDKESHIEYNMAYLTSSRHRINCNSIQITLYPFSEEEYVSFEETQSYELRVSMVNTILEIAKMFDSKSFINKGETFNIVYDMIKRIQNSYQYNEEQKEYIFSKLRWIIINKLIENVSILYTWYRNFKEWTPSEKEVYLKYQPLHNIVQSMKDSKDNEDLNSIYESVNEISNLLETNTYHYFDYESYKPWYIQSIQISAIRYCKLLSMIKDTYSLQAFSDN